MIIEPSPDFYPERRATDGEIGELVALLDAFPYRISSEASPRSIGTGLVQHGAMKCYVHQAKTYRDVSLLPDPHLEVTELIQMGKYVGVLDPGGGVLVESTPSAQDLAPPSSDELRRLAESAALLLAAPRGNESVDALYFKEKHPFFKLYHGMALKDVILEEYELGRNVFYGLIERPEYGAVAAVIDCLRNGEALHDAITDGRDALLLFLTEAYGMRPLEG